MSIVFFTGPRRRREDLISTAYQMHATIHTFKHMRQRREEHFHYTWGAMWPLDQVRFTMTTRCFDIWGQRLTVFAAAVSGPPRVYTYTAGIDYCGKLCAYSTSGGGRPLHSKRRKTRKAHEGQPSRKPSVGSRPARAPVISPPWTRLPSALLQTMCVGTNGQTTQAGCPAAISTQVRRTAIIIPGMLPSVMKQTYAYDTAVVQI